MRRLVICDTYGRPVCIPLEERRKATQEDTARLAALRYLHIAQREEKGFRLVADRQRVLCGYGGRDCSKVVAIEGLGRRAPCAILGGVMAVLTVCAIRDWLRE